jgi:hypothetical protein
MLGGGSLWYRTNCGTVQSVVSRARIFERLRSQEIDSEESIPPTYVAWRAGTTNRIGVPARQAWESIPGQLKRFTNTGSAVYSHLSARPAARQIFSYKWGASGICLHFTYV